VLTFSFGPGDGEFPTDSEAPGIHDVLLPAFEEATGRPAGASPFADAEPEAVATLFAMSGSFIPPRSAVALGIAVYLALGFLLPWAVFSRLRRREWTFAVVILAAALASLAIYRFGLLSARAAAEIEEVSIVRLHHDGRAGEASSFIGVISPRHERRDILAAGGSDARESMDAALPQLLAIGEDPQGGRARRTLGSAAIECRDGRLRLAPVTLYPNGMYYLRADYRVAAAASPAVAFEGADAGEPGRVRVTSRDRAPVSVWRAAYGRYDLLGRVEPGHAFTARLNRDPTTTPGGPPEYWQRMQRQSPEEAVNRILNAVVPAVRRDSILLVSHEGVFPPGREFARRNAVTITIVEVPHTGGD
jgi:hypothetical protein